MEKDEQKVKRLQMLYAAALADATLRFSNAGVLMEVTEQKRKEQLKNGASIAERFGVTTAKGAFEKTVETYGCANFICTDIADGFVAVCTSCMLQAFAKQLGSQSPCYIYCLSPIEAMVKGIEEEASFEVESTLWEGSNCLVKVTNPNQND